jgi:phenylalanyl-tRNA synthetase alpha chain
MDINQIASALSPLERRVFPLISTHHDFDSLVSGSGLQEIEVMRALQWLENKLLIAIKTDIVEYAGLDENGISCLKEGLPEKRFMGLIAEKALSLDYIAKHAGLSKEELNASIGILKAKAAIHSDKAVFSLTDEGRKWLSKESFEEHLLKRLGKGSLDLDTLSHEDKFAFENLKKRKLMVKIAVKKVRTVTLTELGRRLSQLKITDEGFIERLTPELIRSGSWAGKKFRHYDVAINVPKIYGARRHFVSQAVDYIKRIWLDLGFKEMKGTLVQTSFWDLDSLFVPQDHPARDVQDTFYIKDPRYGMIPKKFLKVVKDTHENGWTTGSLGWRYKWSEDIARENLLRTHTTVLSARSISKLKESDMPAKFFSVKKVFRNESLSWSHLFEFIQVEGIVVDPNANFMHLKGYLKTFFQKMGFPDVRIRPGHFPYTEPSAEVDVWHPEKKCWVELGGSGVFRPEVTKPLIGTEVPVLAWGLGMERSIMEYYQIKDIRDLYNNDLKRLREIKVWMK